MPNADAVVAIYQDRGSRGLSLEGVYRRLFDPEFFLRAYGKIYRNAGAMTKGTTRETVDGMCLQKIHDIVNLLRQERYQWTPVRRKLIPKANGKMRPLGIAIWSDKLVQEVLRSLLEPYYEEKFSDSSHGFRRGRGCHSALLSIRKTWAGTTWFIEGDIKGCFDNVDHTVLLETIRRDIHDGRLVSLIEGLLKAGYIDDWKYCETTSGTPQGGIVSPLLANIYLDQLDQFIEDTLIPAYTRGKERRDNPPYHRLRRQLAKARKNNDGDAIVRLKREMRQYRVGDPMDVGYRRLRYIRYADDFLLGFIGPRDEAAVIRDRVAEFLREHLKLELSKEKTLITHAVKEKARFLGYELTVTRNNNLITADGRRNGNGTITLLMPHMVVAKHLSRFSSGGVIRHRAELMTDDDYTIIQRYQSVLQGIYNYYCMATNVATRMHLIKYILETSLTKTLAHKHRLTVTQVYEKYRGVNKVDDLKTLQIIVQRPGKDPLIAIFGGFPLTRKPEGLGNKDFRFEDAWFAAGSDRSEVVQHLLNEECDLCGVSGPVMMHHVRALKDLDKPGKKTKATWMRIMSARRRKFLAVCDDCHKDIHAGRYDGPSPVELTGEPCASKVASTVRGGAVGKGADR